MRFVWAMVFVISLGFTASAQETKEKYVLPSGSVCAVYNDLARIESFETVAAAAKEIRIIDSIEDLREEFHILCNKRPSDDEFLSGAATNWLVRADTAGEQLAELVFMSVRYITLTDDAETGKALADDLAVISALLQYGLNQLRLVSYGSARQTVEISESPTVRCDELLRPKIHRWLRSLR